MSLTFEFPQWQVRLTSSQSDEKAEQGLGTKNNRVEALRETDWAADLDELDAEDEACANANERSFVDQPPSIGLTEAEDGPGQRPSPHTDLDDQPSSSRRTCLLPGGECERGPSSHARAACMPGSPQPTGAGPPPQPASGLKPAMGTVRGDSIPAEVLLLVLSELRDVGDCMRAALVCKHWLCVVTLSNELWFELDSIHLAGGTWHRAPHAGRPLLRPPKGCDHPDSRMLSYKTTCALTQVAVHFMVLRKGFEYVVEAAAALWLAAHRAASEAAAGGHQPPSEPSPAGSSASAVHAAIREPTAASPCGSACAPPKPTGVQRGGAMLLGSGENPMEAAAEVHHMHVDGGGGGGGGDGGCGVENGKGAGGGPSDTVAGTAGSRSAGGASSSGCGGGSGSGSASGVKRGRITHVDQLWESCGRSRTALQVDERFNAVRVQQMVGKLCSSSGALWLPLYEGVAAVMASRCDRIRAQLAAEAAPQPEMREVLVIEQEEEQEPGGRATRRDLMSSELPGVVAEGVLLWQRLLGAWAVYRRWLEVWLAWCGPLGARVEAERQLAGAAAAHGEAPLAAPHLTNKGLMLFRSQVLLAYPLRRPLQAAALWLSARAARAEEVTGGVGGSLMGGTEGCWQGLNEDQGRLLICIRKLLTEVAVPDDVTQPTHQHTRQKLQRCFGGLLRRPVPGGTRALQLAQRMHGLRGTLGGGC